MLVGRSGIYSVPGLCIASELAMRVVKSRSAGSVSHERKDATNKLIGPFTISIELLRPRSGCKRMNWSPPSVRRQTTHPRNIRRRRNKPATAHRRHGWESRQRRSPKGGNAPDAPRQLQCSFEAPLRVTGELCGSIPKSYFFQAATGAVT
jgi:hypothetical protein